MSAPALAVGRRFFAPEVIQISTMDCGPASLKSMLEGFGVDVGYARLREACQTDVDGTSIDVIEDLAVELGLEAQQVMVPEDHLLLPEAEALPALVVVQLPHAPVHFVVVWRRHGDFLQVMDPATGRRWVRCGAFLRDLYVHRTSIPAEAWHEYALSDSFTGPLARRLGALGISQQAREGALARARAAPTWEGLAALDAATRMLTAVVRAGGLSRGAELDRLLERLAGPEGAASPPERYWSARPAPNGELSVRGAVLMTVRGARPSGEPARNEEGEPRASTLSSELRTALGEPTRPPWREIVRILAQDGLFQPATLAAAAIVAAGAVVVQALLLRGLLEVGHSLGIPSQRLGAIAAVLAFALAFGLVTLSTTSGLLAMGRKLEVRLRVAFLEKIPRISDRYFHSRLTSDMADRSHAVPTLRGLPAMASGLAQTTFQLVFTIAGLVWLEPGAAIPAVTVAVVAVLLGLVSSKVLTERDLAARSHSGALSRFYLDALQGLTSIRAHGAEPSLMREQEGMLVHFIEARYSLQRAALAIEAVQSLASVGLAAWLVFGHVARAGQSGSVLLLAYWALQLPVLGRALAAAGTQLPVHRNVTARLLEPLSAPEEVDASVEGEVSAPAREPEESARGDGEPRSVRRGGLGVAVRMSGVSVHAGGHLVLDGVDLEVAASCHVAVVGASGAGKSTLLGLLLGWHKPATGSIAIDGEPLGSRRLARLRRETAWVDPAVSLHNRPLVDNLGYGMDGGAPADLGWVIDAAELRELVERLPDGLQTRLGEGGALVSGGEAQRVRLGRAMMRFDARLVLLDEPFRGLDRSRRRELLARSREIWATSTLLCVTHDVGETLSFPRVLVVEAGRIAEDGDPRELAATPGSRYAALLAAEREVREGLWAGESWRRLRIERGRLVAGERERTRSGEVPIVASGEER